MCALLELAVRTAQGRVTRDVGAITHLLVSNLLSLEERM